MGLTRLLGGASGITNQPQGLDIGISGSNIKSIQRGVTTVTGTTTNVTISAIDVNKTYVKVKQYCSTVGTPSIDKLSALVRLTNSTTITIEVNTFSATDYPIVEWEVIEFNNVKSKQVGDSTFATTTSNITITSVDLNKSICDVNFKSSFTGQQYADGMQSCRLTTSTNLKLQQYSGVNRTAHWQVIEFN